MLKFNPLIFICLTQPADLQQTSTLDIEISTTKNLLSRRAQLIIFMRIMGEKRNYNYERLKHRSCPKPRLGLVFAG